MSTLSYSQHVLIIFLRMYRVVKVFFDQVLLSVFGYVSYCKQTPSCSQFTIDQVRRYGTITGLKKGFHRWSRCY